MNQIKEMPRKIAPNSLRVKALLAKDHNRPIEPNFAIREKK